MLEAQGGVCAICRAAPAAHVDHDHETGAVRALLCFNCNGGLRQFRDDPSLLFQAAFYLRHPSPRHAIELLRSWDNDEPDGPADVGGRR